MLHSEARILRAYKREREALLDTISLLLQDDLRISAAWLAGSLGRGKDDALSDLDLWVVVKQEHFAQLVKARRDVAAQAGDMILFVEAPQNAPAGGGYLAAGYDAPTAPHLVDWYWLPENQGLPSVPMKLLFDRSGSAGRPELAHFNAQAGSFDPVDPPAHTMSFFWMMLLITAKHVARQSAAVEELMGITESAFRQVVDFINSISPSSVFPVPDYGRNECFKEKLSYLRLLAQKMQIMMDRVSELGYSIPDKVVPGAFRYLNMIDNLI